MSDRGRFTGRARSSATRIIHPHDVRVETARPRLDRGQRSPESPFQRPSIHSSSERRTGIPEFQYSRLLGLTTFGDCETRLPPLLCSGAGGPTPLTGSLGRRCSCATITWHRTVSGKTPADRARHAWAHRPLVSVRIDFVGLLYHCRNPARSHPRTNSRVCLQSYSSRRPDKPGSMATRRLTLPFIRVI